MILSIDPGRKPGYVLLDPRSRVERKHFRGKPLPLVIGAWLECPPLHVQGITSVVTELQWLFGPKKKDAALRLAFGAGYQLCRAAVRTEAYPYALEVKDWRGALGLANVAKHACQGRCTHSLTDLELAVLGASSAGPARMGDLLDAIMIGWALDIIQPKPWSPPP